MTLSFLNLALHGLFASWLNQASCKDRSIDSLRDEVVHRLYTNDTAFFQPTMEPGAGISWWKDSVCSKPERFLRMDCHRGSDSIAYLYSRGSLRYRLKRHPSGWSLDRTFACVPTGIQSIIDDLMKHANAMDDKFVASFFDSSLTGLPPFKTLGIVLHSGIANNARFMCSVMGESSIRLTAPQCGAPHWVHHPVFDFSKREGRWQLDKIWQEPPCR